MAAINIDTLCAEILDGWHFRKCASDELRAHHKQLLQLMCKELAVEWHDDPNTLRLAWECPPAGKKRVKVADVAVCRMPYILDGILGRYEGVQTPFSDVLEYTFAEGEEEVVSSHLSGLADATAALRRLWQVWLRDMLLLRWPEAASLTTTWKRLHKLGLAERPDDLDAYFRWLGDSRAEAVGNTEHYGDASPGCRRQTHEGADAGVFAVAHDGDRSLRHN